MKSFLQLTKRRSINDFSNLNSETVTPTKINVFDPNMETLAESPSSLPNSPMARRRELHTNLLARAAVNAKTHNQNWSIPNGFATPPTGKRQWKYSNSERRAGGRNWKEPVSALRISSLSESGQR